MSYNQFRRWNMYYAVIGDIVSSKSLEDRRDVQEKLEKYLEKLNQEYSMFMKKKLSVTLGDEFQGLFEDFTYVLEIIHKIEFEMHPAQLRFGIGVGKIAFDFGKQDSPYQSDGEVWWFARNAIEQVKKKKSTNKLEYVSNIYVQSINKILAHHINVVLDFCYSIKSHWTDKQKELISYTLNNYGLNDTFVINNIAESFNQSVSTIFQKYKSAKYSNYINVMTSITLILKEKQIAGERDDI